jgi:AGZA family xanthine/uracil permease-like MFS transporter
MMYRVRGAILVGILLTSIISWPRSTPVTFFPNTAAGDAMYNYFKQVVAFHKLEKVGNAIEVRQLCQVSLKYWLTHFL